jgi:hypothetical protein
LQLTIGIVSPFAIIYAIDLEFVYFLVDWSLEHLGLPPLGIVFFENKRAQQCFSLSKDAFDLLHCFYLIDILISNSFLMFFYSISLILLLKKL